MNLNY